MWPRRSSTIRVWDFLCGQGWSQENLDDPLASFPKQGCLVLLVLGQPCLGHGVAGFLEGLPTLWDLPTD